MIRQTASGSAKPVDVYRSRPAKNTRVYRRVRRNPDQHLAELFASSAERDIPRDWLVRAQRWARLAAREGYGDEHDLESAAYIACLECVSSPEYVRGEVENPEQWHSAFVWRALRRVRNERPWGRGTARHPHAMDPNVMQRTVGGGSREPEPPRIDPQQFWSDVRESLSDRQFEVTILRHHRGMQHKEVAEECGVKPHVATQTIGCAEHRLRFALAGYLPARSNPNGQPGIRFGNSRKRTRDLSHLMPVAMEPALEGVA